MSLISLKNIIEIKLKTNTVFFARIKYKMSTVKVKNENSILGELSYRISTIILGDEVNSIT